MDEKWAAYRDAVIRLEAPGGEVWVRPAPVTWTLGTYPDPEGRVICVITAHNPGGQTVSEEENAEKQKQLEEKLTGRGWTVWRAAGGDPSWEHVEASAAVVGVEESEVVRLGAEFSQDAIFVLTPAGRRVVGCLSAGELSTGWSVSPARLRALPEVDNSCQRVNRDPHENRDRQENSEQNAPITTNATP
jgi:hypothetical protein